MSVSYAGLCFWHAFTYSRRAIVNSHVENRYRVSNWQVRQHPHERLLHDVLGHVQWPDKRRMYANSDC